MYPPPTTRAERTWRRADQVDQDVDVADGAQGPHPGVVDAGQRRTDRLCPGRQHQAVVGLVVLPRRVLAVGRTVAARPLPAPPALP